MKSETHELNRQLQKSSDGEFLYELEHSFELSPKLSEQILLTAKECLFQVNTLREGQIEVSVIGIEERSGKVLEQLEKRKVVITIDAGQADIEALRLYGRIGLRRIKIQRITEEAIEQQALLPQPLMVLNLDGAGGTIGSGTYRKVSSHSATVSFSSSSLYLSVAPGTASPRTSACIKSARTLPTA